MHGLRVTRSMRDFDSLVEIVIYVFLHYLMLPLLGPICLKDWSVTRLIGFLFFAEWEDHFRYVRHEVVARVG